ncbi:MAG: hypothetical protein IJ184_07120 [Alphaproteobacteria bacterium]|nr:hypothetical protein [Alphaproteobacteria bacterium]
MNDEFGTSANMEWKQDKNGEKNSRVSRRLDQQKANLAAQKSPNKMDVGMNRLKATAPNMKKIRSKIRDVFDEDDEDENDNGHLIVLNMEADNQQSSLLEGLKDEEKRRLEAENVVKNQTMQQTAGKMEAIRYADNLAKENGLKQLSRKTINDSMINIATDKATLEMSLKGHLENEKRINTKKLNNHKDVVYAVKGVGKLKKAVEISQDVDKKRAEKLRAEDLAELGKEKDEKKAAKTILKKTGREDEKKQSKEERIKEKQEKIKTQRQISESLKSAAVDKTYERL